jgi:hypothetical protein
MAFNFLNLDTETRRLMLAEVERDEENKNLYPSKRFTDEGVAAYPSLLKEAIEHGTEASLAESLDKPEFFKEREMSTTKAGVPYSKEVSDIANLTYAEGEFNNYYMRALSLRAISEGGTLEIYRAKEVESPRTDSELKIGDSINPTDFLQDLRDLQKNNFNYPATGWSRGANSGISVKMSS